MRVRLIAVAVVVLGAWLAACGPAGESGGTPDPAAAQAALDAAKEGVNAIRSQYAQGVNAGDAAAVASLYAETAVAMPPNQPAVNGRAAIEAMYQSRFEQAAEELNISPTGTDVDGGLAVDAGAFQIKSTPKAGGDSMTMDGKYMVEIQKQADGSWKISRAIWNTDSPVQMPAAAKK